jgi:hypothetical protein
MAVSNNDMSKGFKPLNPSNDTVDVETLLHESIPLTGSIIANTYGTFPSESNIRYDANGLYIAVSDYPYASSSANHIFDMTAGWSADSTVATPSTELANKNNIYRLFDQQYVGYDATQEVVPFNVSGNLNPADTWLTSFGAGTGEKVSGVVFIDFSRTLMKDEIKMGTFKITLGTGSFAGPMVGTKTFSDYHSSPTNGTTYKDNSPMGTYSFLQSGTTATAAATPASALYGVIYHQAGLCALWATTTTWGTELTSGSDFSPSTAQSTEQAFVSSSINDIVNGARYHIDNIEFSNTTKLNSRVYFCRANHNEFNYSSNRTYTSGSQIVVKNQAADNPRTYVTSVGLYDDQNEMVAVGKLSEPLEKSPENELTLRVRLDF